MVRFSERDISVVVKRLQCGLFLSGRTALGGRGSGSVIKIVPRGCGSCSEKFDVLRDDVYRGAADALVVLIVADLNASRDRHAVTLKKSV